MLADRLWTNTELGIPSEVEKCGLGLSYGGGKRKLSKLVMETALNNCGIAKPVVYDIFGGGGAISFQSANLGLTTIYNDLNTNIYNMLANLKSLASKECEERLLEHFVVYDEFNALKRKEITTPFETAMLNIYSFSGVMAFYTYSMNDTFLKKNAHYFVADVDRNAIEAIYCYYRGRIGQVRQGGYGFHNLILDFGEYLKGISDWRERLAIWNNFMWRYESVICTKQGEHFYKKFKGNLLENFLNFRTCDFVNEYKKLGYNSNRIFEFEGNEKAFILKHFNAWELIMDMAKFKHYDLISWQNKPYDEVEITHSPDECIIMLDPPYKSVGHKIYKKNVDDGGFFDYDKFEKWMREMSAKGYKIYLMEYEAPSDFTCLYEKDYSSKFKTGKDKRVIERLFTYDYKRG